LTPIKKSLAAPPANTVWPKPLKYLDWVSHTNLKISPVCKNKLQCLEPFIRNMMPIPSLLSIHLLYFIQVKDIVHLKGDIMILVRFWKELFMCCRNINKNVIILKNKEISLKKNIIKCQPKLGSWKNSTSIINFDVLYISFLLAYESNFIIFLFD
jgi:hypothetical protein